MKNQKVITVFCANDQVEQPHEVNIDTNGEWLLTCTNCQRTLKFPVTFSAQDIKDSLAEHKAVNEGQITQEIIDKKINELISLNDEE